MYKRQRLDGLRVLGRSAPSPALPLITSLHWSAAQRRELFEALNLTLIECPHLAATLALKSFLPDVYKRQPTECSGALGMSSCTWGDEKAFISVQYAADKALLFSGQGLK